MADFTTTDRKSTALALQISQIMDSATAFDYSFFRSRFGFTTYYKLRAYDLSCVTPTQIVWINTEISYGNAPTFPCSGPYSPIEILESWVL